MATIPDPNGIQRRPSQSSQQPIVRMAGNPLPEAMEALSGDLKAQMDVRNKQEVARATNAFLLLKAEQDNAFDDDPEFETIPSRYKSGMDERLGLAAQKITDPQIRQAFQEEMGVRVVEGEQRMVDLSREKRRQREVGDIANEASSYIKNSVAPNADIGASIAAMDLRFDAAAENNDMPYDAAQRAKIAFRNEIAVNRLNGLPASDRLEVFENPGAHPWLANVDAATQTRLHEAALEDRRRDQAQTIAYEAFQAGKSRTDLLNQLMGMDGGNEILGDALTYFAGFKRNQEADEAETATEAFEAYADAVRFGPITDIKQIFMSQPQLYARMNEQQKSALENMMAARATGSVRKYSDRSTILRLLSLKKEGPDKHDELRSFFAYNIDKLNDSDFKSWSEIVIGEEPEGLFDFKFLVHSMTQEMSDVQRGEINLAIDAWHSREMARNNGRPPAHDDIRKAVSSYIREFTYSRPIIWDGAARPQELGPEERVEVAQQAPSAAEREEFIRLFEPEEQSRIRVEIYKSQSPESWSRLRDDFLVPNRIENSLTASQIETLIAKMQTDPTWPPR